MIASIGNESHSPSRDRLPSGKGRVVKTVACLLFQVKDGLSRDHLVRMFRKVHERTHDSGLD